MAKPHPNCRPVFCWELGETYSSVYAAARAINVSAPAVRQSLKLGVVAGGFHFQDRTVPRPLRPKMRDSKARWVRCHETRHVFLSMKDAASWLRQQGIQWNRRHIMRRVMESCEFGDAVSDQWHFSYVPVKARKLAAFDLYQGAES